MITWRNTLSSISDELEKTIRNRKINSKNIPKEGRNNYLIQEVGKLISKGHSERKIKKFIKNVNKTQFSEPLSKKELKSTIFKSLKKYIEERETNKQEIISSAPEQILHQAHYEILNPDSSNEINSEVDYKSIIISFLRENFLFEADNFLSCFYSKGQFYLYQDDRYCIKNDEEFKNYIIRWTIKQYPFLAKNKHYNELFTISKAILESTLVPKYNSWLIQKDDVEEGEKHFLNLKNTILSVSKNKIYKIDHTPLFFTTTKFPIIFNSAKKCPKFLTFLEEILPDIEDRKFLQQLFGYCLTHDTSLEIFVFFIGEGANGKSVTGNILKFLIGPDNYSTVGFNAFSENDRFSLAQTEGKTLNLSEEYDERIPIVEGKLKQFVSGQEDTIEEKYKSPRTFKPTAKIIALTNKLPSFTDRSNGLWRRYVVINFNTIIPESKQNKDMSKFSYWEDELSGIFNWAIEGLQEILEKQAFNIPTSSRKIKESLQLESNPAKSFILDHTSESDLTELSEAYLYSKYTNFCNSCSFRPLNIRNFNIEVKRLYPKAEKTKNPKNCSRSLRRCRFWIGVKYED